MWDKRTYATHIVSNMTFDPKGSRPGGAAAAAGCRAARARRPARPGRDSQSSSPWAPGSGSGVAALPHQAEADDEPPARPGLHPPSDSSPWSGTRRRTRRPGSAGCTCSPSARWPKPRPGGGGGLARGVPGDDLVPAPDRGLVAVLLRHADRGRVQEQQARRPAGPARVNRASTRSRWPWATSATSVRASAGRTRSRTRRARSATWARVSPGGTRDDAVAEDRPRRTGPMADLRRRQTLVAAVVPLRPAGRRRPPSNREAGGLPGRASRGAHLAEVNPSRRMGRARADALAGGGERRPVRPVWRPVAAHSVCPCRTRTRRPVRARRGCGPCQSGPGRRSRREAIGTPYAAAGADPATTRRRPGPDYHVPVPTNRLTALLAGRPAIVDRVRLAAPAARPAPGMPAELWNLENPAAIDALHEEYAAAGASILTTNTFGATGAPGPQRTRGPGRRDQPRGRPPGPVGRRPSRRPRRRRHQADRWLLEPLGT